MAGNDDRARRAQSQAPRQRRRLSVPIATVFGIQLRVHITFLLLVALFAFAYSQPGAPGPVAGLAWLVVIFACVVVHELAHSLQARRRGGVVHEIDLLPIGGVSKLERLPESPADEFAIAIAGPLASLGIAGLAALVAVAAGQPLLPVDLFAGGVLQRLAWFNLLVGAFNLLPAFPMDGGRVLRALLERRHDLETATRQAARVGRLFAVALIAVGIFFNLFLAIIGIFVYFGASAEEAATVVHLRLKGMRVADVMLLDPIVVDEQDRVEELRARLRYTAQTVFPVTASGAYRGILLRGSIGSAVGETTVGDIVLPSAPVVAPGASLEEEALPLLEQGRSDAIAVVDGTKVVGLLRRDDVVAAIESHEPIVA